MGALLAKAALDLGHEVVIVSGPVVVDYPEGAEVISVLTTDEMLDAAVQEFAKCDGAIGAAAPVTTCREWFIHRRSRRPADR